MITRATFEGLKNFTQKKVDTLLKKEENEKRPWIADMRKKAYLTIKTSANGLDKDFKKDIEFLEKLTELKILLLGRWTAGKRRIQLVAKFGKQEDVWVLAVSMNKNMYAASTSTGKPGMTTTVSLSSTGIIAGGTEYWLQKEPTEQQLRKHVVSVIDDFFKKFSKIKKNTCIPRPKG